MPKISAAQLFSDNREKLRLDWIAGRQGGGRELDNEHLRDSREGLIGHLNFIHANWIQVIGRTEFAHLNSLAPDARQRTLQQIKASELACMIVADGEKAKTLAVVTAPTGGKVEIEEGLGDMRRGPGLGPVPNPFLSPTPGIETMSPHTIIQGAPDTQFTLTGVNFVQRSVVYVNGEAVPTNVASGPKLTFMLSANILGQAGKLHVVVKNPLPLTVGANIWGDTSNQAHILVPFSFTTAWSHNEY